MLDATRNLQLIFICFGRNAYTIRNEQHKSIYNINFHFFFFSKRPFSRRHAFDLMFAYKDFPTLVDQPSELVVMLTIRSAEFRV